MQKREINASLRERLGANGFAKDGRVWCRDTDDLFWRVDFESLPHWRRVEVGVGCTPRALAGGDAPSRTNDCLTRHGLHALPLQIPLPSGVAEGSPSFSEVVRLALNIDSAMSDEDRVVVIESAIDALSDFLGGLSSESDLDRWIREGQADRRGFVHRAVMQHFGIPLDED